MLGGYLEQSWGQLALEPASAMSRMVDSRGGRARDGCL